MRQPRVLLTELREYRSATGSTYFAGYLGKARGVMLREDRAEITGKEVARWNVLLEERQPREGRENHASGGQDGRGGDRAVSAPSTSGGRPGGFRSQNFARRGSGRDDGSGAARERSAQDRSAGALLRERGIDPASPPPDDALPF